MGVVKFHYGKDDANNDQRGNADPTEEELQVSHGEHPPSFQRHSLLLTSAEARQVTKSMGPTARRTFLVPDRP